MNINATSSFSNMQLHTDYNQDQSAEVRKHHHAKPKHDSAPQAAGDQVSLGGADKEAGVHKKWTFLHFGAGDNNLSSLIKGDVDEMEKVGSDANTHVISMLDQSYGDCKTYYITKNNQSGLQSPVVQNHGSHVDMSDPKTLANFIAWGVKNYPSDNVAVILGSHGGGTMGALADDKDGNFMSPQGLRQAFQDAEKMTGKKIDVLGFDCCLMANTEVAYELKDVANYIVASEESEGGNGWPYHNVLNEKVLKGLQEALDTKLTITPEAFAKKIVGNASGVQSDLPTMSSIDTSKMGDVAKAVDGFANAIIGAKDFNTTLKNIARRTEDFNGFKDIYHFCEQVADSKEITDNKLKAEAKKVMAALDDAIIANQNSYQYPNAHGLQMEIPASGRPSNGYGNLQFAKDTHWDEALNSMRS